MYLSHAVRTIRDDPTAGESVDLVVTLAEGDGEVDESAVAPAALADALDDLGGTVVADLRFSAVHVRLPETAVADLCELDGVERIETAETLRLVGDEATAPSADAEPADGEERTDPPATLRESSNHEATTDPEDERRR
jgi:hypothetical protein